MPESIIMAKLVVQPRIFARNRDKFRRTVEEVKKLGFNSSKQLFLIALQALMQISKSTWERNSDAFSNGVGPMKIFFLLLRTNFPALLSYSLQRRLIPRGSIVQALLSKGLIEKFNVCSVMMYTEKEFLQKIVTCYGDSCLLKLYKEKQGL
ncbi:hypothetical protein DITRI_Ditri09bG0090900 [Diplodiscus trichospermus]